MGSHQNIIMNCCDELLNDILDSTKVNFDWTYIGAIVAKYSHLLQLAISVKDSLDPNIIDVVLSLINKIPKELLTERMIIDYKTLKDYYKCTCTINT